MTAVAERVGPSVIGLGRGWGRGSGVVIAEGRVLTNAHVLRGDEVAVRRPDGEVAHGRVAGAGRDLDVAVIEVDTGGAPAVAWDPAIVADVRAGQPVFALADPGGRGLRTTFGLVTATGRSFRGPRGRRIGGIDRALRAAPARLLRRPAGRRRRAAARHQLGPHGGRAAARAARPTRRSTRASRRSRAARRRRGRGSAWRSRLRAPLAGCARPSGCLSATGCSSAPWSPTARPRSRGCEPGDLLVAAGDRPLQGYDELFDALEAAGELTLTVVRGTDEREVTAHFS